MIMSYAQLCKLARLCILNNYAQLCTCITDLVIECIHNGTGYTLFVFGIHTGYTL